MTRKLKQIYDSIISQQESALNQSIPLLEKAFMRVNAKSTSSVLVMLEYYANFMLKQWFVATCSSDDITVLKQTINPLNFWGSIAGVSTRKMGERAEHEISVVVENIGETLDAGTQLISSRNGFTYITTQSYTLTTNPILINIKAVSDPSGNNGIGADGNLQNGAEISFVNPLAQVGRIATVTDQFVTGANPEKAEDYRKRVKTAFRRRKQGGAYIDYFLWGTEVDGIPRVYPYTGYTGEVDVYVEATPEASGNPDGIPTPAQLQSVFNSIEFDDNGKASRRPVGSFVNVYPITRTGFKVVVSGLIVDNVSQVQTQIKNGLSDLFFSAEPFITGLSVPPRKDRVSQIAIESVINDIVTSNNGSFIGSELLVYSSLSPIPIYDLGIGEKAKLSEIEFI